MKKAVSRIIVTLVFFAGIAIKGQAQETVTQSIDPNAPEIAFESEVIDFGTVDYDANITKEFKFKNTGKTPLILSDVHPGCGCTTPESWPKEPIKPGGTGIIKVKYDTKRVGSFEKTITVTSNAKTSSKIIRIKGIVKPNPTVPASDKK
jgi:hypothetical protein